MTSPKLFISYPSESWNFAQRIAENLAPRIEQSIFIDYRSIDQVDFAEAILSNLKQCDAMLLIITEFTFADIHRDNDWLRVEIRTALEQNIPIVLVRENALLPPDDVPEDIQKVRRSQGIPFYREFFNAGMDMLVEFLLRIGVVTARTSGTSAEIIQPTPPPSVAAPEPQQRIIDGQSSVEEAADLLDAGNFEKALVILQALKENGKLRPVMQRPVDELLAHAQTLQAEAERHREATLDYEFIAAMARRKWTEAAARAEFVEWCEKYPDLVDDLDMAGLKAKFGVFISRVPDLLPAPFAWIEIPGGRGTLKTSESKVTLQIPTQSYAIAKYPVTNAQYAKFIDAGGYKQQKWWTTEGWETKKIEQWTEPRFWNNSNFNDAEQPVVAVSWFEAVAFCLWLSDAVGEKIMLPTEAQWQYAAQGSDGRAYPWGNEWDVSRCNNRDNGIGKTTPVRQYEGKGKGDSPFGVVDMAGNVWEWCLTNDETGDNNINENVAYRMLRGGSWNYGSDNLRAPNRNRFNPALRSNPFGFRCACS